MHIIIRQDRMTGHRYVLTDGLKDRVFKDREAAEAAAKCLRGWGSTHDIEIYDDFKSSRQAREYCRLLGEGLDRDSAIQQAKETIQ